MISRGTVKTTGRKNRLRWLGIIGVYLMAVIAQVLLWRNLEPRLLVELWNENMVPIRAVGVITRRSGSPAPFRFPIESRFAFSDLNLALTPGDTMEVTFDDRNGRSSSPIMLSYAKASYLLNDPAAALRITVEPDFRARVDTFDLRTFEDEEPWYFAALTPVRLVQLAGLFGWVVTLAYRRPGQPRRK